MNSIKIEDLEVVVMNMILTTIGLPTLSELEKALSKIPNIVELTYIENPNRKSHEFYNELIERIKTTCKDRVKIRRLPLSYAIDYNLPSTPALIIHGIFNGRLRHIGLMEDLMEYMIKLSIAYAGKSLEIKKPKLHLQPMNITIDLYVVPGVPCIRTLKTLLPLPAHFNVVLNVIDARENSELAKKYPGTGVPLTVVREKNYFKRGIITDINQLLK